MISMKRIFTVFIFILSVTFLLSGCGGTQYSSWKAKGVDFNKYTSYAWIAPGDSMVSNRRDDKLYAGTIMDASNQELSRKGMIIDSHNPDVLFTFDTRLENMVRYQQAPTMSVGMGFGGPGYYVGGMAPVAGGQISAIPYSEGMLIIEMHDRNTGQVLWRGTAQSELDNTTDVIAVIRKACKDIFFYLPIKHKK